MTNNTFKEIIIVADRFMREVVENSGNVTIKGLNVKIIDYERDVLLKL
jgi:hypothetical protein